MTFGGALFAAFPNAYATVFSGFYIAFMLLLLGADPPGRVDGIPLQAPRARLATVLGPLLPRSARPSLPCSTGLPSATRCGESPWRPTRTTPARSWTCSIPIRCGVGVMALSLFVMHGNIYLYLKTEGELQKKLHGWIWHHFFLFLAIYVVMTVWTMIEVPHALANFRHFPVAWVIVVLNVLAIANIPRAIYHNRPLYAFVSSSCTIAALVFLVGMALYPNLVTSSIDPATRSVTIYQDASSMKTLQIMLIIAVIGMPFVLSYTVAIYWVFRGKVQLDSHSY